MCIYTDAHVVPQQRGLAVIGELWQQHNDDHIVLATHGNLVALILQHYDSAIDYNFWKSMTMPDIYRLSVNLHGETHIDRIYYRPLQAIWKGADA